MSQVIYNAGLVPAAASVTPAMLAQPFTRGASVASTSGTAIDFTSIPSWVKRITLALAGVSTSGSSELIVRIGSGSFDTTGYLSFVSYGGSAGQFGNSSTCFQIASTNAMNAAYENSGIIYLVNISGNIWVSSSIIGSVGSQVGCAGGGRKSLSGSLTQVRLSTKNGTDTFDLGSVNIFYE